jgi:predicted nucleic-acid-binding Zn-ribbon protein
MERKRIENAVDVIKFAINNNVSITSACLKCGYSDTYVKNVKKILNDQYTDGLINDNDFNYFNNAYDNYLKIKNKKDIKNNIVPLKGENIITTDIEIPKAENEQLKFDVKDNEGELTWTSGKNYPKGHIKTLDELLKACDVDLNKWNVDSYTVNKWDVTSWKSNKPETIQNYQVKARLVKMFKSFYDENISGIFKDLVKNYTPPVLNIDFNKNNLKNNIENNLLEISIQDLHYGKMAWTGETGENYDTKIARERFLNAINTLIKRAIGFEINQILFLVGSDFFNSDNLDNTTTKGTPQDEDGRKLLKQVLILL